MTKLYAQRDIEIQKLAGIMGREFGDGVKRFMMKYATQINNDYNSQEPVVRHRYEVRMLQGIISYSIYSSEDELVKTRDIIAVDLPFWTYMTCTGKSPEAQQKVFILAHELAKEDVRQLDKFIKE